MGNHFAHDGRQNNANDYAGRRFKSEPSSAQPSVQQTYPSYAQTSPYGHGKNSSSLAPKKRRGPIIAAVVAAVVLVLLVAGGVAGFKLLGEVKAVKNDATAIIASATQMKDDLKSGNGDSLFATSVDIQNRADNMHETTQGFLWNAAALVPVYGSDVKTVQTISAALDTLAENVISPLASSMQGVSLSSLMGDDGTINVEVLTKLADALTSSKETINQVADEVAALPTAHISQLQEALDKAKPLVATLNDGVNVASEVAPYLPQMLGANGQTRNYLIIAQSNAELRATGGFPGATGFLTITDGKISFGRFKNVSGFSGEGAISASPEEIAIFGDALTTTIQNVTANPDFPASAQHVRDLWNLRVDATAINGVIAVDPVFLQSLLALTGGVPAADGSTIDGTNAAQMLLHDVYVNKPVNAQDQFFSDTAETVAKHIMGNLGKADMSALMKTVKDNAKASRLQVWMADQNEEAVIDRLGFSGALTTDETKPTLGVFINDETWAKLDWYLSSSTDVSAATVNADGTKSYQVTTRFKNNITEQEAYTMPKYITGYDPLKRDITDMVIKVYFYAPAGGSISNMQANASFSGGNLAQNSYNGLSVLNGMIQLKAQEDATFTYTVTTSANASEDLNVRTTPLARSW